MKSAIDNYSDDKESAESLRAQLAALQTRIEHLEHQSARQGFWQPSQAVIPYYQNSSDHSLTSWVNELIQSGSIHKVCKDLGVLLGVASNEDPNCPFVHATTWLSENRGDLGLQIRGTSKHSETGGLKKGFTLLDKPKKFHFTSLKDFNNEKDLRKRPSTRLIIEYIEDIIQQYTLNFNEDTIQPAPGNSR